MKFSALAISVMALATVCGGPVLAQATAPVTMQPVPNPPEKAKAMHAHKAMHHKKVSEKAGGEKTDKAGGEK